MTNKTWGGAVLGLSLIFSLLLSGLSCFGGGSGKSKLAARPTLTASSDPNERTRAELLQEIASLRQRIAVLAKLPEKGRGGHLHDLQTLRVARFTGLYDKNEDGQLDKLLVYLQPVDKQGDVIKVPGRVTVQLWRLDPEVEQGLVCEWLVEPEALTKQWFATMMSINYRLDFDLPASVMSSNIPLTVKVEFTDLLSGQVFKEQKPLDAR